VQNINRYENDKTSIKDSELVKLATALNVSADFLLGLSDDPTPPKLRSDLSDLETEVLSAVRDGKYVDAIDVLVEQIKSPA
jgi:transcriptional regulator with XRE-family HTH domain